MSADSTTVSLVELKAYRAVLWGGLIAGSLDISAAFINSGLRGRSPMWVLQSIAAGLLGADSFVGGTRTAALGGALHFLIAFVACAVYFVASRKLDFLTQRFFVFGLLYGVVVYAFMYQVVLRLAFHNKIAYTTTMVITGLLIHMFCVGLPISVVIHRLSK
jgi:hypothetical protein